MSKYIIELDDTTKAVQKIAVFDDGRIYTHQWDVEDLEELNSDYINEHFRDLQDTAYQRGLNDAWEAAKKIVCDEELGWNTLLHIFNRGNLDRIFGDLSPSEAIAKLKAYEEKQKASEEIKVGDIVDWSGEKYIVSYINDDGCADLIYIECGSTCERVSPDCFTRTGKHYNIEKILEEMKE